MKPQHPQQYLTQRIHSIYICRWNKWNRLGRRNLYTWARIKPTHNITSEMAFEPATSGTKLGARGCSFPTSYCLFFHCIHILPDEASFASYRKRNWPTYSKELPLVEELHQSNTKENHRTDLKLQCRSRRKGLKYFTGKILNRNKGNLRLDSKYILDFINIFYCCSSFASDEYKK